MQVLKVKARFSYEVTENIVNVARETGRALVRQNVDVDGELTPDELTEIDELYKDEPESAKEAYKTNLKKQKGTHYTQLLTADEIGVNIPVPTDAAALAQWDYFTPNKALFDALPTKKGLCSVFSEDIATLLADTPFAKGIDEKGQPVAITGVQAVGADGTIERVYYTRYRVVSGWSLPQDYDKTMHQALVNGLLRDISNGDAIVGATKKEKDAYLRQLQKLSE